MDKRRIVHNTLLLTAGLWLLFECGRWGLNWISEYRLTSEVKNATLPLTAGAEWPLVLTAESGKDRTLVLALSSDCAVCVESVGFYRDLIALSRSPGASFSVFALLQKRKGNFKFMEDLRISRDRLLEVGLRESGVRETPTLWVVGRDRRVLLAAAGRLSKATQGKIEGIARGQLPASMFQVDYPIGISLDELTLLETARDVQVIDVRPRVLFIQNHRRTALNIPLDELPVRATEEMNSSKPAVIDCSWSDPRMCDSAAYQLGRAGFSRLHIFNRGATPPSSCETTPILQ